MIPNANKTDPKGNEMSDNAAMKSFDSPPGKEKVITINHH